MALRFLETPIGALAIPVQGVEALVGHGESSREVHPASDDLDVAGRFCPWRPSAIAASSSPSVATFAVNQPRQPRAAGRA